MAMNASTLGTAIKDTLVSHGYVMDTPEARAECEAIWGHIAGAIVAHIQTHAEVSTTVATGIPVSTTGTAAAQTGQTTATGTGSGGIS